MNTNDENNESCISINRKKEPLFKEFVLHEIECEDSVLLKELVNAAAKVGISPVTAKRYLDKLTAGKEPEIRYVDYRGETSVSYLVNITIL